MLSMPVYMSACETVRDEGLCKAYGTCAAAGAIAAALWVVAHSG